MRKTDAQRQATYRERNFQAMDGGMARLNTALSVPAKAQLERLATRYGVTETKALPQPDGLRQSGPGGVRGTDRP